MSDPAEDALDAARAAAWEEGYVHAIEPQSDIRDNPYACDKSETGGGEE